MKPKFILMLCALVMCIASRAQDTDKVQVPAPRMLSVETVDGSRVTGTLVFENDSQMVLLSTSIGRITIPKSVIKEVNEITENQFTRGQFWFKNPHSTRHIIGPTAFSLNKGEGYYQNLYLFGQSVNYGITPHISVGGGFEIASLIFAQEFPYMFFLTPKIGYELSPKWHAGAGLLYVHIRNIIDENNNLGIAYGILTYGSYDNNATLGVGWGMHGNLKVDGNTQKTYTDRGISPRPIITLSGMTRLSKRFALVTENWIFSMKKETETWDPVIMRYTYKTTEKYDGYFSYGMRFMSERNSIDFGFINNKEIASEIYIGIPYIDFVIKFDSLKRKK